MLFKRVLLVVPAQYHSHLPLPRDPDLYTPTHAEIVIALGSYTFAALVFISLLKLFPVVELPVTDEDDTRPFQPRRSSMQRIVMFVSLLAGLSMVAWGIATRNANFAPLKWLLGLLFLVAIPLENCLIKNTPARAGGGEENE